MYIFLWKLKLYTHLHITVISLSFSPLNIQPHFYLLRQIDFFIECLRRIRSSLIIVSKKYFHIHTSNQNVFPCSTALRQPLSSGSSSIPPSNQNCTNKFKGQNTGVQVSNMLCLCIMVQLCLSLNNNSILVCWVMTILVIFEFVISFIRVGCLSLLQQVSEL